VAGPPSGLSVPELSVLLGAQSFFSEGRSTISPRRLVELAARRGFTHVGLTDYLSVSGAVELCQSAGTAGLTAIIGATLPVRFPATGRTHAEDRAEVFPLVLLARGRVGYAALCELITEVKLNELDALSLDALAGHSEHLHCLTGGRLGLPSVLLSRREVPLLVARLRELRKLFPSRLHVQLTHDQAPGEARRLSGLRGLARDLELPTVAAPEVHLGEPEDYPLLDALSCARLGLDVGTPHPERPRNDSAHVGTPQGWGARLPFPDALLNARRLADECALDLLPERLASPEPPLPPGQSAQDVLEARAWSALPERYPIAQRPAVTERLRAELGTVRELELAGFFLTAAEVTDYCRSHGILAAGRGSAAGSVLCYLLGITLADPIKHKLLFERFLHTGRAVMPDVDIDIASSRRDQVLGWVEERWGGGHLNATGEAMVANRITYRLPSAVQDLGRALGLPPDLRDRLSRALGRDFRHHRPHRAREAEVVFTEVLGEAPVKHALLDLLTRMEPKFFRHHAPHSGGVVLSQSPLTWYSPLSRSSGGIRMLAFDKDDVETLGLIKLDLLGLRMLAALERAREEALRLSGEWVEYGELPDDPAVWARIAEGDTMGLFQVESPAQVQMSARLQPNNLTELAHQIALVRPGPIQSGTVHPYVRRARGEEAMPVRREPLHSILAPTHGTLMFQEQILRIAVQYAGFSWPEADRLRSRLSKAEDPDEVAELRTDFLIGALFTHDAPEAEAREIFELCAAFRGFGFAESHAWAFAQHSYASAWMRQHHPAAFLAGLLTEAPGMWPESTLGHEARRWGVGLLPVCISRSAVAYRAETPRTVRLPLSAVQGLSLDTARQIVQERLTGGRFCSLEDAYDRLELSAGAFEQLVLAGAFDRLGLDRRAAAYTLQTLQHARPAGQAGLLGPQVQAPVFPALCADETLQLDLATTGLSASGRHPLDAHRARLRDLGCVPLGKLQHGQDVWTAGLIIARQRPPTAAGFAFYMLEDGHHRVQAIISPDLWEAHRQLLRDSAVLIVQGAAQVRGLSVTVQVRRLCGLTGGLTGGLTSGLPGELVSAAPVVPEVVAASD
jgi:error-prone DNA polymerase